MQRAYVCVGLGYGDEGKGAVVSGLAQSLPSSLVIRFNGGSQAGHNVVTADGRHHTFSQFGSGTFTCDSETHYSAHALFNPVNLIKEEEGLRSVGVTDAFKRFSVAESARVITPYHVEANRQRELSRGDAPHGTCAHGVGETMIGWLENPDMTVYARDLWDLTKLKAKLRFWRDKKGAEIEEMGGHLDTMFSPVLGGQLISTYLWVAEQLTKEITLHGDHFVRTQLGHRPVIFEGAQGVLLDEDYGFHPHTTWSRTTPHNARELLEDFDDVETVGIMRSYMTRHGHGPLVTEDPALAFEEPYNDSSGPQGEFRQGHLDMVALRYAVEVCERIDSIALTHTDRIPDISRVCVSYNSGGCRHYSYLPVGSPGDHDHQERLMRSCLSASPVYEGWSSPEFVTRVEEALEVPVKLTRSSPSGDNHRYSLV